MAVENGLNPSSNLGRGIHETFKFHATDDIKNSHQSQKILSVGRGISLFLERKLSKGAHDSLLAYVLKFLENDFHIIIF